MNILILTDHTSHTSNNSFYGIANALLNHSRVSSVTVVSRGLEKNQAFFTGDDMTSFSASAMTEEVTFPDLAFFEEQHQICQLGSFDVILLRLPYPIADNFFEALSEKFNVDNIINRPSGIQLTSDKAFLLNLKPFVPPVQLCNSLKDIRSFAKIYHCVLKPRRSYGGTGIVRVEDNVVWVDNKKKSFERFARGYAKNPVSYLAMKYLKNVTEGDKRIVVADGHVLSTSLRMPANGGWMCNVSQGGVAQPADLEKEEVKIVKKISPVLSKLGIFLYGIDTLVNDDGIRQISEINTLSVGGLVPSEILTGQPVTGLFADLFVKYCNRKNVKTTHHPTGFR